MKSLLIFTIGPVQSFIAQARKTQDLYAGSRLISYLCRTAARKAIDDYGAEIIYPDLNNPSLPNRFVALLPVLEKEGLQEIGRQIEETVKGTFLHIGCKVVQSFGLPVTTAFRRQLEEYLEVFWVAGKCDPAAYAGAYREMESLVGAMKNIRPFSAGGEQGRKCSMTGQHNALFYRGKKKAFLEQAVRVPDSIPARYLAPGESLGGIGFLKRTADQFFKTCNEDNKFDAAFPSTAGIALEDSLLALPQEQVEKYKGIFGKWFNDQFFYEENLTARRFAMEGIPGDILEKAKLMLKELSKAAVARGVSFSKYYALLVMDGDSMGEWVAGKNLADRDELLDFQRRLTRSLGAYAGQVKAILEAHHGRSVYCGGDDLLALINLQHLLAVLQELRESFPALEQLGPVVPGKKSSTSAGVCIAHYKAPLAEVIKYAREMERTAKHLEGKDAVAIGVIKHSGEICQAVVKWKYENVAPLKLLCRLVDILAAGWFSDTFIRNLAREFSSLSPGEGRQRVFSGRVIPLKAAEEEIIGAEIARLLRRSCLMEDRVKADKAVKDLCGQLLSIYVEGGLANFLSFLDIAAFLSREVKANGCNKDRSSGYPLFS